MRRATQRDMIEVEARLERASQAMAERERHRVGERDKERALATAEARGLALSGEQRDAFYHATDGKDFGVVIGYAGTGKSAMLGVAREAWEGAGFDVRGAAVAGGGRLQRLHPPRSTRLLHGDIGDIGDAYSLLLQRLRLQRCACFRRIL